MYNMYVCMCKRLSHIICKNIKNQVFYLIAIYLTRLSCFYVKKFRFLDNIN